MTPDKQQLMNLRKKQPSVLGTKTQEKIGQESTQKALSDEAYKNANFSTSTASSNGLYVPPHHPLNGDKSLHSKTKPCSSNSTEFRKQLQENGKSIVHEQGAPSRQGLNMEQPQKLETPKHRLDRADFDDLIVETMNVTTPMGA